MKRITVLYTTSTGAVEASEAIMFDDTTLLQIEGEEWLWLGFAFPIKLTAANELHLNDDSMYSVMNIPAIKMDPALVERMTAVEYMHHVARVLVEEVERNAEK